MNYRELGQDEVVQKGDEVLNQHPSEEVCRAEENWSSMHGYVGDIVSNCIGGATKKQRTFRRIIKMQDFSSAKVGDKVWSIFDGDCHIKAIDTTSNWPIKAGTNSFLFNGKRQGCDAAPSLFWSNPNIIAPKKPKKVVKHKIERYINLYPSMEIDCVYKTEDGALVGKDAAICKGTVKATITYETLE